MKLKNLPEILKNIYFKKKNPISLVHFLTNRCNARCSFCFIDFDNHNTFKNELTLSEISTLAKSLPKTLMNVNFTGGEPFARKDIFDIAKLYIQNTNINSIYITTNGSLPDRIENFTKKISEFAPEIEIGYQISIDHFPDKHDKIRKIKNLFDKCIDAHNIINNFKRENITSTIGITISEENCSEIEKIFDFLVIKNKIKNIKPILVRDEGVYKTPKDKKVKILKAYTWITNKILEFQKSERIQNYNKKSLQGRLHYAKDQIAWQNIKNIYEKNTFISPCHASTLFGVIAANGDVFPCEILENKLIGNLRSYKMNFTELWHSKKNNLISKEIIDQKCKCTYECGMSFNILGNIEYLPTLLKKIF
jgi:radical SAM protein with 4Fe4S-binding SPASM domain